MSIRLDDIKNIIIEIMYIPISQDINKFYVNIEGTTYPVKKMLLNTQEVTGVEVYADYYSQYFTIESLEDNNVILCKPNGKTIQYYSNGSWTTIASYSNPTGFITLNTGDKVMLKGTNTSLGNSNAANCCYIGAQKNFKVYGNIMSLLYGDDFEDNNTLTANYAFAYLFFNNDYKTLVDASNLKLPATTLTAYCYYTMFYGCTSLTTAPVLPATTLASGCYNNMFTGCTSLTSVAALPATTLVDSCYGSMFMGCSSLTTAPTLPATNLASGCYSSMFYGCSSLTTAPVLPATTLASGCYTDMFEGCTSLTKAPELLATVLVDNCYSYMFYGCTSLNEVVCLATDISAQNCITDWLGRVSSTGTFYKDSSMTSWPSGSSGIPTGWTIQNYS